MTRDGAIEKLKAILAEATEDEDAVCYVTSDDADALDMAIKALEAFEMPLNDNWDGYSSRLWKAAYERGYDEGCRQACKDKIESPYCAESEDKRTEKHACDCISREAVIETIETDCSWDIFNEWGSRTPTGESIIRAIKRVPSVEPERKVGKWKHMVGFYECDQCHAEYTDMPTCMGKVIYEYCPMCGSKMEVDG